MTDGRFADIPEDADTQIIRRERIEAGKSGGTPAIHETWTWRGVVGESLIFENSDVEGRSDEDLLSLAEEKCTLRNRDDFMIRRSADYVFVSFNFDTSAIEKYLEDHGVAGVQMGGDLMI